MPEDDESSFGEYIRHQRELHELTMRQLADMVGISNPYLSQIERGLREPSERVLEAIAENLEMSAETLRSHKERRSDAEDEEPAAPPVAVLGHFFWRKRLGADPTVVGEEIEVNGVLFTVVGVAREGFLGAGLPAATRVAARRFDANSRQDQGAPHRPRRRR